MRWSRQTALPPLAGLLLAISAGASPLVAQARATARAQPQAAPVAASGQGRPSEASATRRPRVALPVPAPARRSRPLQPARVRAAAAAASEAADHRALSPRALSRRRSRSTRAQPHTPIPKSPHDGFAPRAPGRNQVGLGFGMWSWDLSQNSLARGNSIRNVVPLPGVDCTSSSPSCIWMMRYTIERPIPVP